MEDRVKTPDWGKIHPIRHWRDFLWDGEESNPPNLDLAGRCGQYLLICFVNSIISSPSENSSDLHVRFIVVATCFWTRSELVCASTKAVFIRSKVTCTDSFPVLGFSPAKSVDGNVGWEAALRENGVNLVLTKLHYWRQILQAVIVVSMCEESSPSMVFKISPSLCYSPQFGHLFGDERPH